MASSVTIGAIWLGVGVLSSAFFIWLGPHLDRNTDDDEL